MCSAFIPAWSAMRHGQLVGVAGVGFTAVSPAMSRSNVRVSGSVWSSGPPPVAALWVR